MSQLDGSTPATAEQTPVNYGDHSCPRDLKQNVTAVADDSATSNVSSPKLVVHTTARLPALNSSTDAMTIAPISNWRCDSIPADDEDDNLSEFRLQFESSESACSGARVEAMQILTKMFEAISQLLSARQIDFSRLLSSLATLHGCLQCLLISREVAAVALNNSLNKAFRELLGELTLRCTVPLKMGKYKTSTMDQEQAEAMAKLTLSMREQIEMASNFADLLEVLWYHLRFLSGESLLKPFMSVQKHVKLYIALTTQSANEWIPSTSNWLTALPCPSARSSRCRYRLLRAAKLFASDGSTSKPLITMSCRLIDSLFWVCQSRLFSALYPLASTSPHPASDTSLRALPMSLENFSAILNLVAAWQAFGSAEETTPLVIGSDGRFVSQQSGPRGPMYGLMITETRELFTVLEHLIFPRITRKWQLKPGWVSFLSAATCMYVHFATLLIVRSKDLRRTAEALAPMLSSVASRMQEVTMPISSTEPPKLSAATIAAASLAAVATAVPETETGSTSSGSMMRHRRLSWTRPQQQPCISRRGTNDNVMIPGLGGNASRIRSLSDSSNALAPTGSETPLTQNRPLPSDEPIIAFSKKEFPTEWRPKSDTSVSAEVQTLPLGLSLLLPHHLAAMTDVIEYLPVMDGLHLWTLLCIAEAQPQAAYIISNFLRDAADKTSSIDVTIDWLCQAAAEGSQIFESRLGRHVLNWEQSGSLQKSEQSPERRMPSGVLQRRDDFAKMAQSLWKVLALRFLDVGVIMGSHPKWGREKFVELLKGRTRNDESCYASAFIRVVGDGVVQAAVDDGMPLVLFTSKPKRRESDPEPSVASRPLDAHSLVTLEELKRVRSLAVYQAESKRRDGEQMCMDEQSRSYRESLTKLNCLTNTHTDSLTTLQKKTASIESQLTNLIEGPMSRHSNQIKSFMDRFDSLGQEIRRLSGISATQTAAASTQVVELKRVIMGIEASTKQLQSQLEALHGSKEPAAENILSSVESKFRTEMKALAASIEEKLMSLKMNTEHSNASLSAKLMQYESDLNERIEAFEAQATDLLGSLKHDSLQVKEELHQQQRQALSDALENLQGLSHSVKDILDKQEQSELGFSGEDMAKLMQATDRRFGDMMASLDERFACWASSQDVDSLKSLLSRIEGRIAAVESKTRITESALSGGDKLTSVVSKRLRDLETTVAKLESELSSKDQDMSTRTLEVNRIVEDLSEHFESRLRTVLSESKSECTEMITSLKKKVKHEYVAQLIAKTDNIESQLLSLRSSIDAMDGRRTRTPPIGSDKTEFRTSRWETAMESMRKMNEQTQWDLQEVRQTLDTMLSASMTEIQSLRSDLERMRRERKNCQEDVNSKALKLDLLETSVQTLLEEREKSLNMFGDLQEKQMVLQERLGLLEAQQLKSRKLHFWSNKRSSQASLESPRPDAGGYANATGYTLAGSPSDMSNQGRNRQLSRRQTQNIKSPKQPRVTAFMNRGSDGPRASQIFSPISTPKQLPGDTVEVMEMNGGLADTSHFSRGGGEHNSIASPALSSAARSVSLERHMLTFDAQEDDGDSPVHHPNQQQARSAKRSIFMACMSAEDD